MRRILGAGRLALALCALGASPTALPAAAATLYAVSGEHSSESNPESLFTLDPTNGTPSFVRAFGAGSGGEAIAGSPGDGLLYHASGSGAPNDAVDGEILETFDPATLALTNVPLSGFDYNEATALTWSASNGALLMADLNNGFYDLTTSGVVSLLGTLDHDAKGLAFVSSTLYSVDRDTDLLRSLDPSDGSTLGSVAITLAGSTVNGATGLAVDPDTGILWALLKLDFQSADRHLVTIDPSTGAATGIGGTGGRFAGLAFGAAPIPEPGSAGLVALGLLALARRRPTHRTP